MHFVAIFVDEHHVLHNRCDAAARHVLQRPLGDHVVALQIVGIERAFHHGLVGREGIVVAAVGSSLGGVAQEHLHGAVGPDGLPELNAVFGIVVYAERGVPELHVAPVAGQRDGGGESVLAYFHFFLTLAYDAGVGVGLQGQVLARGVELLGEGHPSGGRDDVQRVEGTLGEALHGHIAVAAVQFEGGLGVSAGYGLIHFGLRLAKFVHIGNLPLQSLGQRLVEAHGDDVLRALVHVGPPGGSAHFAPASPEVHGSGVYVAVVGNIASNAACPVAHQRQLVERALGGSVGDIGVGWQLVGLSVAPPSCPEVEGNAAVALGSYAHAGVNVGLAKQEFVQVGLYLGILRLRQRAVAVPGHDAIAHAVVYTELLPHLQSSVHGDIGRGVGQPHKVGIAQHEQGARTHHGGQLVVVVGQIAHFASAVGVAQRGHKPVVVGLVETLHRLGIGLCVEPSRIAPCGSAAASGFLGNGQCHALVEGSAEERHLAGIRTAGDADALHVNLGHVGPQLLQSVDESAQSPCPLAVGTVVDEFGIEAHEVVGGTVGGTAHLRVGIHLSLRERHAGNGAPLKHGAGQRDAAGANHQGIGCLADGGIGDFGTETECLAVHGDVHPQRVAVHLGTDGRGVNGRLLAYFVVLYFLGYLTAAAGPVGETAYAATAVRPFEGVGEHVDFLTLVFCRQHGSGVGSGVLHVVDQWDGLRMARQTDGQKRQHE